MKLGGRVLKTGVAIVFALFIAELLNISSPVFAGIAAIFAIQPSIYRSYLTIVEQVQGNLIGATVAIIFGLLFGHHIVAIGIAAIIVIGIMMKLKLEKAITLAIVTLIIIMEFQGDNFMTFALIRFGTIMIGVFAACVLLIIIAVLFLLRKRLFAGTLGKNIAGALGSGTGNVKSDLAAAESERLLLERKLDECKSGIVSDVVSGIVLATTIIRRIRKRFKSE